MASNGSMAAGDLLQKLGRPGFPQGMVVMLLASLEDERQEIEEQLSKLMYQVVSCGSCCAAKEALSSGSAGCFDIVLAEASMLAKDCKEGQAVLEAASDLPLVLISSPDTTTECVWRGIEVGAADVLEKPLSQLKLQNIWQHVVRKVMDRAQPMSGRAAKPLCKPDDPPQVDANPPSSRCTPSSSVSAATLGYLSSEPVADPEASFCDSQDGKEASLDASMSNTSPTDSYAVDSSSGLSELGQPHADGKPAKRPRCMREGLAKSYSATPSSLQAAAQASSSMPANGQGPAVGIAQPPWAGSSGSQMLRSSGSQMLRGSAQNGCVWGTPLHPPPGWQGKLPNGAGPLLGAAASQCTISRCHSAPVKKAAAFRAAVMPPLDGLLDVDPSLMDEFADDLLLSEDFMDCGDNFIEELSSASAASAAGPLLEQPPIGLHLKKSQSFVDLINQHLQQCRARPDAAVGMH